MRKGPVLLLLLCVGLLATLQSCRNDEYLAAAPATPDQSFVEQFDTMQNAYSRGWRWINRSVPIGPSTWTQAPGPASGLGAYSSRGTNTGAAFADYLSTAGTNDGTISNWLISPSVTMQNGDKIIFYTKTQIAGTGSAATDYGARLQVCINTSNNELNVGNGDDAGNFEPIFDLNPNEDARTTATPIPTAYPADWTRFEVPVFGLNSPVKGHFAFRYYLHNAGSNGAGNGIGIDSVAYVGKK